MRGAAVFVLLCIGSVVLNTGATKNEEYGGGMTVKEEAGKRQIVLRGGKNDVPLSEETHEDGSRSRIYKKETKGNSEDTQATESRKDGGGMTVKDEPGKRQIIPQGGQNNYKELITDKTYENGLRSTIFKKETMRKLENKINLIVVMEEVFKNKIHPEGFKVIRTVVTESVDEKDPRKNSLSFDQSETYPDFKLWTPMFPDNRPVEKTNNQQEHVPQPTAGILATPIPQQDPESAQTLNEMAGAYPTQYGPGSGYNPQDPSRVNQYSSVAAQNGDKVSAQTLNGIAGAYPS
uniref:p494-like protein n=1 Tax=Glyptapanteles flavicoxis TaxID=463051 RepID=B7S858_9HYME|nr:P494-like protein [Glyptapanteles flavicoxis]